MSLRFTGCFTRHTSRLLSMRYPRLYRCLIISRGGKSFSEGLTLSSFVVGSFTISGFSAGYCSFIKSGNRAGFSFTCWKYRDMQERDLPSASAIEMQDLPCFLHKTANAFSSFVRYAALRKIVEFTCGFFLGIIVLVN